MNKKDFWTLVLFNLGIVVLLIEHLLGLTLALEIMIVWTMVSLIVNICVLRNYVHIYTEEV